MDSICRPSFLASSEVSTAALLCVLPIPHMLYCFIWLQPQVWRRAFGKTSVDTLASTAFLIKVLQYGTALAWFASQNGGSICFDLSKVALWQWVLSAALLAYGQLLNLSVYNKLGKNGVYYGCKLGHTIPWVTGFPFDSVPHPQYVGSAMTSVAAAALFSTAAPAAWPVAAYWCSLYACSGFIEQNL